MIFQLSNGSEENDCHEKIVKNEYDDREADVFFGNKSVKKKKKIIIVNDDIINVDENKVKGIGGNQSTNDFDNFDVDNYNKKNFNANEMAEKSLIHN